MKLAVIYDPQNDAEIICSRIADGIIGRLLPAAGRSEGHIDAGHGIIYDIDIMHMLFAERSG